MAGPRAGGPGNTRGARRKARSSPDSDEEFRPGGRAVRGGRAAPARAASTELTTPGARRPIYAGRHPTGVPLGPCPWAFLSAEQACTLLRCSGCTCPALGYPLPIVRPARCMRAWHSAVMPAYSEPLILSSLSPATPCGSGAAQALGPAPAAQRLKAACPSAQGRPAPAASAPAWPAGSARGLHPPSLSFSVALTPAPPAVVCGSCSAPG